MKSRPFFSLLIGIALGGSALTAESAGRKALIIGNGDYLTFTRLTDPLNDAELMNGVFQKLGFTPYKYRNLTNKGLHSAFDAFHTQIGKGDEVAIYYSGHGVQVAGENYVLPIDLNIKRASELQGQSLSIEWLLKEVQKAGASRCVVFLDSCRTDGDLLEDDTSDASQAKALKTPASKAVIGTGALDEVLTCFATEHGKAAFEGPGPFSLYTQELARELLEPGRPLDATMKVVRNRVIEVSGGDQKPYTYSSVGSDIVWMPGVLPPRQPSPPPVDPGMAPPRTLPEPPRANYFIVSYTGIDGHNIRDSRDSSSTRNLHGALFQQVKFPLRQIGDTVFEGGREWIQLEVQGWVPIRNRSSVFLERVGDKHWKVIWNKPGDAFVAMRTGTASTTPLVCKLAYATVITEVETDFTDDTYHYVLGRFSGWVVKQTAKSEFVRRYHGPIP